MTPRARRQAHRLALEQATLARQNASKILGLLLTPGLTADELVEVTSSPEMSQLAIDTAVALAQRVQRDIKLLVLTLTGRVPDAVLARFTAAARNGTPSVTLPELAAAPEVEEPWQVGVAS